MQKETDQTKVAQLLSSISYFQSDSITDLESFFQSAGTPLTDHQPQEHTNLLKEYGDLFSSYTNQNNNIEFLQVPEIYEISGKCGEKSLWSVINLLLYNNVKQIL